MKELDIRDHLPEGFIDALRVCGLRNEVIADLKITEIDKDIYKVHVVIDFPEACRQDDIHIRCDLGFEPDFFWAPHLTPESGYVIDQHVFRTPAVIAGNEERRVVLFPDPNAICTFPTRCYLDMDAEEKALFFGLSETKVVQHILFIKKPGAAYEKGKLRIPFYVILESDISDNPFRRILSFFWEKYGRDHWKEMTDAAGDLNVYIEHTYRWAFNLWKDVVWQEFNFHGKRVGAPVFLVTATQSPGFTGRAKEREVKSIWNQAWFCCLRSASGLYRHARRVGDERLKEKALMTKELALSFPQEDGLFNSVVAVETEECLVDGEKSFRSLSWDTLYEGNSDRNPFSNEIKTSPKHILDMSFTAYYMLIWYDELEKDPRLLEYALTYAVRLIELQDSQGFYPGWVDGKGTALGVLDKSPETSMSAVFLLYCFRLTGDTRYRDSALRALHTVMEDVVPSGRWEDFETYWSCSPFGVDNLNCRFPRNKMYKQCNFSIYYTALALYEAYELEEDQTYLVLGCRVLDELLMTQASWQPDFMPVSVVGGFGVMNADAEWNDARQSLFAELIVRYGLAVERKEYIERGLAALRASFVMMYCPENRRVKTQWEKAWPFFSQKDYGFTMENYGHNGVVNDGGLGMGEFTIYDWGNGAACEAFERMLDHLGWDMVVEGKHHLLQGKGE